MTSLDHGFAVVENCYTAAECDRFLSQMPTTAAAGSRCLLDSEWCQTLARTLKNRVSSTAPGIGALVAVQCTFFNKSPDTNWFVAFHQDRSIPVASSVVKDKWSGWSRKEDMTFIHGPDQLLAEMLALRLHIDNSGPDNGPLRVIPNSHKSGTLSLEDIESLRESSSDETLTARKGDVVLMRPLLLHASSKSRTMESRRVLHFLFGPQALPDGLQWRRAV